MEKQREAWGSRFAFIMAAAGFAIGLGNMWRFPYLTGTHGGGAFVLVYVAFGWLGVLAAFFICTYYMQIMGWLFGYIVKTATGQLSGLTSEQYKAAFDGFMANPVELTIYTAICMAIVAFISARGIKNGIEKVCNILMPLLFVMLVILAIRSVTLPGAMEGVKWYLKIDFSKIDGQTVLDALGQAFFSIGIASGGGFIYGSYLEKDSNVPSDGLLVVVADTCAALLSGFVMFPAIFALGLEPGQGKQLLFVTMSNLFDKMPGGIIFAMMFFTLVFFAALLSAIGYFEPVLTTLEDLLKWDRVKATWIGITIVFIVGFPTILAHNVWKDITIMGMNIFDFDDYLSGNILMPLGAIVLALYTVFVWKFENFKNDSNASEKGYRVMNWWKPLVMFLIPAALIIILVRGVFF